MATNPYTGTQLYQVRMTVIAGPAFAKHVPHGSHVYLSHRGRSSWSKRTAQKHCADVSKDPRYSAYYSAFEVVEN